VTAGSEDRPVRPGTMPREDARNVNAQSEVVGNERLTALASAVLLVLLVVEIVTIANLHTLLSIHVLVGVLLAGPLAVKFGSVGYRFVRYYTGSPAFVRKGPPRLALRILAPLLVATTLVVIGSGIGLLITGPTMAGPLRGAHSVSTVIWLPLFAIHVFAYIRRIPRLIADDWRKSLAEQVPGRTVRLGVILGALVASAVAATLALPLATPWVPWIETPGQGVPGFLIAGMVLTALALLAARPLRWR
jgi:hypothetical protein